MFEDLTDDEDDAWCVEQRQHVLTYLSEEGFRSPSVSEWPAWHVAPLVAVWALESVKRPGFLGWWVVSGDLPTDYILCSDDPHPRQALQDIGSRWRDAALKWAKGEPADGWGLRHAGQEKALAPLLAARGTLLLDIAAEDSNWDEEQTVS